MQQFEILYPRPERRGFTAHSDNFETGASVPKLAFLFSGDFLRWFSICGGGQIPSIRTRRFSGSGKPKTQNPIQPKNEVLRWAGLWIEFWSIRMANFRRGFLNLATASKLNIERLKSAPVFLSTFFRFCRNGATKFKPSKKSYPHNFSFYLVFILFKGWLIYCYQWVTGV